LHHHHHHHPRIIIINNKQTAATKTKTKTKTKTTTQRNKIIADPQQQWHNTIVHSRWPKERIMKKRKKRA
jgi:hypothetical protein